MTGVSSARGVGELLDIRAGHTGQISVAFLDPSSQFDVELVDQHLAGRFSHPADAVLSVHRVSSNFCGNSQGVNVVSQYSTQPSRTPK